MSTFSVPSWKLRAFGCVSALLYLTLFVVFWTDRDVTQPGLTQAIVYATIAILTLVYFAGIRLVGQARLRDIVIYATLFAVIGFATGPFDSTDVYFYMAQGWQQAHYGVNPYSHVLRDTQPEAPDPMISSQHMERNRNPWLDQPIPYGFGFALLIRAIAWLGGGNWWLTFTLFNLLNVAIHASVAVLLWKTAALIPGATPKLIVYLYAWSPLVVLQYLANVHNDIIMASLIVLAFYFLLSGRERWVTPVLVVAGFVKYVAFALVPFGLVFVYRRRSRVEAMKSAAMSLLAGMLISLPYVWDLRAFKLQQFLAQLSESTGSLHAFITFSYRAVMNHFFQSSVNLDAFSEATKVMLWAIVAMFGIYQLRRSWLFSRSGPMEVADRWTSILFAVVFIGSSQFYTWYIGMVFPLSLLGLGGSRLTDIIVLLSGTHMAFNFMRGKAIGYFILTTALPVMFVLWRNHKAPGLAVVKTRSGPLPSKELQTERHGELLTP